MNANDQLLDILRNSDLVQSYEHAYNETTGLPLTLRPVESWKLPFHGKRGENAFCALMAGTSHTCASCLRVQEKLSHAAMNGPFTVTCDFGLSEMAVPVKLGVRTIGFLQTGQMARHEPSDAQISRIAARLEDYGMNGHLAEAREAYVHTPVVGPRKIESMSNLLSIFADHLSMKSNQIAVYQSNAEPPVIVRAKQFIEEHHKEDLSLGQVAKSVNTSIFYFCKLFRKVTGITFTEHIARTRVEKAKNFLLNRNLRVSEIAYEVGFRSLTHFNRMFKSIVGESPSEFRNHLPSVGWNVKRSANGSPSRSELHGEPPRSRDQALAP
jgi:AraC-like DNA-binding protein